MAKYLVQTRAIVNRHYYVDAENPKDAEAKSMEATIDHEEDQDEETMDITEVVEP